MMTKIITKLVLLSLVLIEIVLAKPVSVFDKKVGQLVTSSLLTWEPFHINNLKQLEYAVVGGEFSEVILYVINNNQSLVFRRKK